MESFHCINAAELREVVAWAAAEQTSLRIRGGGSKLALGRPVAAARTLDLGGLDGVIFYEPEELVLRARAGTKLSAVTALLAETSQTFGFEPPDLGPLLGARAGQATLGGMVSVNASGPRRFRAGAARDHVLGVEAVSGRGEVFKSGGRVVKNVTGYDLPKLMAGAYGTLGVLFEVTMRLVPAAEDERTVVIAGLSDRDGVLALRDGVASPVEVSGAAHLPQTVARISKIAPIAQLGTAVTVLRLEGTAQGLATRVDRLLARLRRPGFYLGALAERGGATVLNAAESRSLWREIADVDYFVARSGPVWRVSTAPSRGPAVAEAAGAEAWYYDWCGGLVWLCMAPSPSADATLVRRALADHGGHATLIRAVPEVRGAVSVFEPQSATLAALTRRIKEGFDPRRVLNPGLMYPDV